MENFEPLKDGWFKPRETTRFLIDHASKKYILFLLWVTTYANAIVSGSSGELGNGLNIYLLLLIAFIIAPILGYLSHMLNALILFIFGKIAKGEAKIKDLFRMSIGATMPLLFAFPFSFAWAVLDPENYLALEPTTMGPVGIVAGLTAFATSIWALVNLVIGVSEAHKFSIGKAIFTIFTPIILLIILFVVIIVMIVL